MQKSTATPGFQISLLKSTIATKPSFNKKLPGTNSTTNLIKPDQGSILLLKPKLREKSP